MFLCPLSKLGHLEHSFVKTCPVVGDNMWIIYLPKHLKIPKVHYIIFHNIIFVIRTEILFPHHHLVVYSTNTYNNLMLNIPSSMCLSLSGAMIPAQRKYNVYHLHNNNLSKQNQYHVLYFLCECVST